MPYLRLTPDPIEVNEVPERISEAPLEMRMQLVVTDVVTQALQQNLCFAPQSTPSALMLVGDHVFGAAVQDDKGGEDGDWSWVPTLIEAIKMGRDEVVREVVYFGVDRGMVAINAWNCLGDAVSGVLVQPLPFLPAAFNAHGHMPKKADAHEALTFCETVGKYLWGPAWDLAIAEEDRC